MEVAMEIEDDLFFQDLSKQISLLIMDDDEDPVVAHCPSVSLQAFSRVIHPSTQYPILYDQNCRRESKGTGVFIPRSSQPRRKNRQGRFNSSNTKSQRQQPDNTRGVSHQSYYNNNSLNPKKC